MPRTPGSGRKRGTPNKVTRAAKEFLESLCDDPVIQRAVRRRILKGDTTGFFRAIDKIMPDPPKKLDVDINAQWVMALPAGDDVGTGD